MKGYFTHEVGKQGEIQVIYFAWAENDLNPNTQVSIPFWKGHLLRVNGKILI